MARPTLWHRRRTNRRRPVTPRRLDRAARWRTAGIEPLETRCLLTSLPFGAHPHDGSEVMLGDVLVTVVLMESDGSQQPSTEDWTPPGWTPADGPTDRMQAAKQMVREGVEWWEETLARQESVHQVDFLFDFQYADAPVPTAYEPIANSFGGYEQWVADFLRHVNPLNPTPNVFPDMRSFNHAQRTAYGTDWAFTVFVVDSQNDADNKFEPGEVRGAFAFAGGPFLVMPSRRAASVVAHETGHIFYALDEYDVNQGGAPYTATRGYYNTQNLNATDDQNPNFRVNSIMDDGQPMLAAYDRHLVSPSGMEMIGWKDSDNDGIFDIQDVPHKIEGTGAYDPASGVYRFVGTSSVDTLPNLNPYPYGLGNDITLNRIHRAEYRVDDGPWQQIATYDATRVDLDLSIPHVPADANAVQIRTVDANSGVTSQIFTGDLDQPTWLGPPGTDGFIWLDLDADGQRENGEPGLAGWSVTIDEVDGPAAAVTATNDLGAFSVVDLADGSYRLTVAAPPEWAGGAASPATHLVTVSNGAADHAAEFAVAPGGTSFWQNSSDPLDVDADGEVTVSDMWAMVEVLEVYGVRDHPLPMIPPYVDTNGDGRFNLQDAASVMRRLMGIDGGPSPTRAALNESSPTRETIADNDPVFEEGLNEIARVREGEAPAEPQSGSAGGSAGASPSQRLTPKITPRYFASPECELVEAAAESPWQQRASAIDKVFSDEFQAETIDGGWSEMSAGMISSVG